MHATTIIMQHDIISQLEISWELWGNEQREKSKTTKSHSTGSNTYTQTASMLKPKLDSKNTKVHAGMSQMKNNLFRICGQHIQGKNPFKKPQ